MVLGAVACSGSHAKSGAGRAGERVVVRGSDTMVTLAQRWAEAWREGDTTVEVSGGGSGTGIAALTNGTADVATASRRVTEAESDRLRKRAGPAVETIVALDAVAIYVNEASPLESLSIDQVSRIYQGEIRRWSEVGGPARPIAIYSRENSSGTYAFFKERVLGERDFASEVQCLPGTAAVVRAVARDPHAIGYGGIAAARGVRALSIRTDRDRVVAPTRSAALSGEYPLARPLFLYLRADASPAAQRFVAWTRNPAATALAEHAGFYPPREAERDR